MAGRPPTKRFLGDVTTEIRLGPIRTPLAYAAKTENIYVSDLILRECGRYLVRRNVRVDPRILNPAQIVSRLRSPFRSRPLAAANGGGKPR